MTRKRKLRKKAKKNCKGKDYIIIMTDHAIKKGHTPEQTEIFFEKYDLEEIWESARIEPDKAEVEKVQFIGLAHALRRLTDRIPLYMYK